MPDGHTADRPPLVAAKIRVPAVKALPRERLHERLGRIFDHKLGLVIAPAGAGKTTLLAQFAHSVEEPVAWFRAESADGDAAALLAYLRFALAEALGGLAGSWRTIEDAATALERWGGRRALLVIDDLHALRGSPAEAALARLLDYAPRSLVVLAASRSAPGFDVSRLQVAGDLLEVRADDLRFRSWEVERLFRDVYRAPHPPEELAELARRTEGWAAGLQLFHLATRGRRADERRGILLGLASRSRFVREYLAGNVLGQLPPDLRRFLVDTCVLGRLSGALCDRLLGGSGSAELLDKLARGQIFTFEIEHEGTYRYHEVLRSYLSAVLVDEVGEAEARRRHVAAGAVLEEAGALHDALVAFCRGESWHDVGRLLGHEGEQIAHGPGEWLDLLPAALMREDPWVQLATARRWRAAGRLGEAVTSYRGAEEVDQAGRAGDISRRERLSLTRWLERPLVWPPDWSGLARAATVRDPLGVREQIPDDAPAPMLLVAGLAALLAGYAPDARATLERAAAAPDATATLAAGAWLGAGVAALLAGDPGARAFLDRTGEEAEAAGVPVLARFARTLAGVPVEGADGAHTGEDPGVAALEALCRGLAALHADVPAPGELARAARSFTEVGADVMAVWCTALRAVGLARQGADDAVRVARVAESRARTLGVPGAQALALIALAAARPKNHQAHGAPARRLAAECGIAVPAPPLPAEPASAVPPDAAAGVVVAAAPPVALRCFGRFQLTIEGAPCDFAGIRPRVRSLLRFLALHADAAVHREIITEALWPESKPDAGIRSLHVAVSTLRGVLPSVPELAVVRDGDAYCLTLPEGSHVDVVEFTRVLGAARDAEERGDLERAVAGYERTLDLHDGELLPEEGPADWVVAQRQHYDTEAADAAEALALLLFDRGDAAAGALACRRGLEVDRYRDGLWRVLVDGLETAGDAAAAARARQRYEEILAELGVGSHTMASG